MNITTTLVLTTFLLFGGQPTDHVCELSEPELLWRLAYGEAAHQPDQGIAGVSWVYRKMGADRGSLRNVLTGCGFAGDSVYVRGRDAVQPDDFHHVATIAWLSWAGEYPDPFPEMDHFDDTYSIDAHHARGKFHYIDVSCAHVQVRDIVFYRLWNCPRPPRLLLDVTRLLR